jgi:hypothetical protein
MEVWNAINISMAPITSKGMMNAVEPHSNKEVIHGSNRIKPLFRHLPINRQVSLRQILSTPRVKLRISVGSKLESWQLLCYS